MSADLLAEFGDFGNASSQQQQAPQQAPTAQPAVRSQPAPSFSFFDDLAKPAATSTPVRQPQPHAPINQGWTSQASGFDDNDDWGDFEGGASEPASTSVVHNAWSAPQTAQPAQQSQLNWQPAPVIKAKKSADPSVLFDAEDGFDEDGDDFGDFEGEDSKPASPPASAPARSSGVEDLLGDLNMSQPQPPSPSQSKKIEPRKVPSQRTGQKSQIGGFGTVSRSQDATPSTASTQTKQEDSWDSFDDWEASIPTKKPVKKDPEPKKTAAIKTSTPQPTFSSSTFDEVQPGETPPTNVPPPALLLTLFSPLFSEAQTKLFRPMAAQTLPMRNKLLSEPATITYLQAYLMISCVAARVIAGRKLRWKRDAHLSQGMRIGPASSRATSGMKLTGIDRSENMREEREVADVVRAWKEQIGRLRHVVSAANQGKAGSLGSVPDIQETMPVKTLKQGEGGVPAPQPCMLCGLKRDERVATDQEVEDSFGEWWVDQVSMHRGCRNFWHEHKNKLQQR